MCRGQSLDRPILEGSPATTLPRLCLRTPTSRPVGLQGLSCRTSRRQAMLRAMSPAEEQRLRRAISRICTRCRAKTPVRDAKGRRTSLADGSVLSRSLRLALKIVKRSRDCQYDNMQTLMLVPYGYRLNSYSVVDGQTLRRSFGKSSTRKTRRKG